MVIAPLAMPELTVEVAASFDLHGGRSSGLTFTGGTSAVVFGLVGLSLRMRLARVTSSF